MLQTAAELKTRVEAADLWPESTNEDRCDNCRCYLELREGIGYCVHRQLDMVVGGPWWCKLWAPRVASSQASLRSPPERRQYGHQFSGEVADSRLHLQRAIFQPVRQIDRVRERWSMELLDSFRSGTI